MTAVRITIPPSGRKRLLAGETITFQLPQGTEAITHVDITLQPPKGIFDRFDAIFDELLDSFSTKS